LWNFVFYFRKMDTKMDMKMESIKPTTEPTRVQPSRYSKTKCLDQFALNRMNKLTLDDTDGFSETSDSTDSSVSAGMEEDEEGEGDENGEGDEYDVDSEQLDVGME
jgi:hypothetical protein